MVAPGTALREGLDNIVHARTGALICIGESDELSFLFSGGIKLEVDYTPALLYQLAKMDGAIILSANAHQDPLGQRPADAGSDDPVARDGHPAPHRRARLEADGRARDRDLPAPRASSRSTSTARSTSSRTSRSSSPRPTRRSRRSTSTAARLDQVSTRLTALEFEGGVTLHDVLTVLQRAELVTRMAVEIERYIVELGTEGRLIEMQLEETMVGVAADKAALVHDYLADYSDEASRWCSTRWRGCRTRTCSTSGGWPSCSATTASSTPSTTPSRRAATASSGASRACRRSWSQAIVREFGGLDEMLAATDAELEAVEGVGDMRAKDIREGLRRLQEINLVDRYLQT